MDLQIKTETFGQDDQSWLASAHGTDTARNINISVATFTAGTHYPDGWLKSGLPLKKVAGGRYGLWSNGDTDPIEGHLFTATKVPAGATVVVGALLWHGAALVAKLPTSVNAAGQATARDIRYF
ncbi:potassium transporter [Rhodococcus pseudokoreensis]|uniref:Potassium transporter n=1 Tax=Rhodococcus pseudokoreensis TaxID=2811421 RepID=A0A974WBK8_9NOCA|nr:potassium transporter [Rhodococcus pseudokoreensis]QSE94190.1 potassium transporter [Rhodococcus pseudokoreensis]